MKKLYCPECGNYLEGGSGDMVDCSCGWRQPDDTSDMPNHRDVVPADWMRVPLEPSDEMVDAPRQFLAFYAGAHRQVGTAEMRRHLSLSGVDVSEVWPPWALEGDVGITKGAAAILIWTMMLAAAPEDGAPCA